MRAPVGMFIPDAYGHGTLHQFHGATAYMSRSEASAWCAECGVPFITADRLPQSANSSFRNDKREWL